MYLFIFFFSFRFISLSHSPLQIRFAFLFPFLLFDYQFDRLLTKENCWFPLDPKHRKEKTFLPKNDSGCQKKGKGKQRKSKEGRKVVIEAFRAFFAFGPQRTKSNPLSTKNTKMTLTQACLFALSALLILQVCIATVRPFCFFLSFSFSPFLYLIFLFLSFSPQQQRWSSSGMTMAAE